MKTAMESAPWCVGRDFELCHVRDAVDTAAGGHGRFVLVVGDAGIGKTRLAEFTVAVAARKGFSTAWGRCWEAGGAPAYWPWIEAIRGLVSVTDPEALAAAAPSQAREAVRLVPELAELLGKPG